LNQLDEDARQAALDDMDGPTNQGWDKLEAVLTESGSLGYARAKAEACTQAAIASLQEVKEGPARQNLEDLALFLSQRLS
jgi:geranylgeranyl pyrophosphate synthase